MKLSIILLSYKNTASIGSDKLSQVLNAKKETDDVLFHDPDSDNNLPAEHTHKKRIIQNLVEL